MLTMMADSKQIKAKLFFLAALFIGVWAYFPGLGGTFIFDDVDNISGNPYLKIDSFSFDDIWQASWSGYSGPLRRPVAMLSFGINHIFTGMDPWWMKLSNLIIHIVNSFILLLLCKELFHRINEKYPVKMGAAPYVIAGLWFVHPVNVTSVSYIVQRMTSLSGTFVLLAILCYLKLRNGKAENWRAIVLSLSMMLSWALGLLTKEIAISLSIYVFAIEWCVYGFQTDSKKERKLLGVLWALIAAPWVCALFYAVYDPSFLLSAYKFRDFSPLERVLTEFRIVMDYLRLIIIPDIQDMGLYHDDIMVSTSLFSPISTLLSLFLIIALLTSAIYARQKFTLYSLGVFWFFGGHLVESTVYPLELMFLHRNYLPSIGIFFILAEGLACLLNRYGKLLVIILLSILAAYSLCTRSLAYHWSGDYRMLILEVMHHPQSVRANFRAGQVYKVYAISVEKGRQREVYRQRAFEYFGKIQTLDKNDFTGKMGMLETYLQLDMEPPQLFIEELVHDLSLTKVDIGLINLLYSVKNCMIEKGCPLQTKDYHSILQSLLNNPNMTGDFRRKLLINHAEYLAKAMGNIDAAITTILEAFLVHPTPDDLMLLALYYEKGGYKQDVLRTVDYLEEQDKFGRFRKFINETRKRLE